MSAKLTSRIPQVAAELRPVVNAALKAGAQLVAERAKIRVPVDEGDLREAIHVERGQGGYLVIAGTDDIFYGHMVEHGTSHSAPRPFLVPTLEESRDEVTGLARSALMRL